ncbi:MAG: FliO/MopB family protein [Candidatus Kapabacteria bacterium]|nr:FliO/MopB family protein [Candidatus Kapabacteria bacterium]
MEDPLLRAFITMSISVAGILGVLWYVKRRTSRGRVGQELVGIEVIARQALNPKAQIFIVKVSGKTVMLGVTEQSVTNLGEVSIQQQIQQQQVVNQQEFRVAQPTQNTTQMPQPIPGVPPPLQPVDLTFSNFVKTIFKKAA